MKHITVNVETNSFADFKSVASDMIDLSNRLGCDVQTSFNGIRVKAYCGYSTVDDMTAKYMSDCSEKTEREKRFWNELTLEQVLKKMGYRNGKMKFPCYGAELLGEDYTRYIRYYAFKGVFDPRHECSILLSNLFWDEAKKRFGS